MMQRLFYIMYTYTQKDFLILCAYFYYLIILHKPVLDAFEACSVYTVLLHPDTLVTRAGLGYNFLYEVKQNVIYMCTVSKCYHNYCKSLSSTCVCISKPLVILCCTR